jgi:hypothetical protein
MSAARGHVRTRGNMALEAAMWLPVMLLLLIGMVQIGKVTYVYYQLKKDLYTAAQFVSKQQGIDFCNVAGDATVQGALNFALTGTTETGSASQFPALSADMIQVTTECADPAGNGMGACSTTACDVAGAQRPDYIVVSIPDGYQVSLTIPHLLIEPILLRPQVRVPFGGT